jgi:hypothetical protein
METSAMTRHSHLHHAGVVQICERSRARPRSHLTWERTIATADRGGSNCREWSPRDRRVDLARKVVAKRHLELRRIGRLHASSQCGVDVSASPTVALSEQIR